jgi:Fe-S-cluster-containing dehydrogenase component
MGVAFAMAPCIGCGATFTFNPVRVPSIRINGSREPICRNCVARVNPIRRKNGLAEIVPLPDAYDACDESEMS